MIMNWVKELEFNFEITYPQRLVHKPIHVDVPW